MQNEISGIMVHSELFKYSTAISENAFVTILRNHIYSEEQIAQLLEKFREGQIIVVTHQAIEKEGVINEL